MKDELLEQIKTARNLFTVAYKWRENHDDKDNCLHTLLELGFEQAQEILDKECIKREVK